MASHAVMPYDFEHDSQWRQFSTLYEALKRRQVDVHQGPAVSKEAKERNLATRAHNACIPHALEQAEGEWPAWEPERRQVAVDLLCRAFSKACKNPHDKLDEVRWKNMGEEIWSVWVAGLSPTSHSLAALVTDLFKDLVNLFGGPILAGDAPFTKDRQALNGIRSACRRLQGRDGNPRDKVAAERLVVLRGRLQRLAAALEKRVELANTKREEYLEAVESLQALFAQLVPAGAGSGPGQSHTGSYFAQLPLGQQGAAVGCIRAFLSAACEHRAAHGEPLDPKIFGVNLLNALGVPQLVSEWVIGFNERCRVTLCMDSLSAIHQLYVDHRQAASIISLAEQLSPEGRAEWASLISSVPLNWQCKAVTLCRQLLRNVQSYSTKYGQLPSGETTVRNLATVRANLDHQKTLCAQHTSLQTQGGFGPFSLGSSSRRELMGGGTVSRFFPGARSSRW
ncbi:hypothetical protein DMC30DRAFT_449476 [Rhodotorula diobovata]|uniref:Uncharacterized protein n=1 Tax=Rhodotorula diobovata TaxID=5288 RepID=A0A5C5FND3_9BASI|nr:hypothetical protein DMC30DRAFT_449476 [Rhodotorula diobovata]